MKPAVQAAIAEQLNLSQGTVSRALRNRPGIRPQIRAKVLEAASEHGYQLPSLEGSAQDPQVKAQGHIIGVLVHSPHARWRREGYLIGMSAAAPNLDVTLVLQHIRSQECRQILFPRFQPPVMRNGLLKALVLVFRWPDDVVRELSRQYTCISMQHEYPGIRLDVIGVNHRQAMHEMMERLYRFGHRQIGFVGRCGDLSWSRARFAGYVDSLCQFGLEYSPDRVVDVTAESLAGYDEQEDEMWLQYVDRIEAKVRGGVQAWMASSDYAAECLRRGLMRRGLRVPEDVSITGFDAAQTDAIADSPLDTVSVPMEAMGAEALKRAVERLKNPALEPSHVTFSCSLRPGKSSGPPRAI